MVEGDGFKPPYRGPNDPPLSQARVPSEFVVDRDGFKPPTYPQTLLMTGGYSTTELPVHCLVAWVGYEPTYRRLFGHPANFAYHAMVGGQSWI